jgi:hypothetical protein
VSLGISPSQQRSPASFDDDERRKIILRSFIEMEKEGERGKKP